MLDADFIGIYLRAIENESVDVVVIFGNLADSFGVSVCSNPCAVQCTWIFLWKDFRNGLELCILF